MQDRLEVRVEPTDGGRWPDEVVFRVNGSDLRQLVPVDAGWVGPPSSILQEHPDHLRGGPDRWELPNLADPWYADPAILACGCGQPGCRAVLAHIEVGEKVVRWSRLRYGSADEFMLLDVGPFIFERARYEAALEDVEHRQEPT